MQDLSKIYHQTRVYSKSATENSVLIEHFLRCEKKNWEKETLVHNSIYCVFVEFKLDWIRIFRKSWKTFCHRTENTFTEVNFEKLFRWEFSRKLKTKSIRYNPRNFQRNFLCWRKSKSVYFWLQFWKVYKIRVLFMLWRSSTKISGFSKKSTSQEKENFFSVLEGKGFELKFWI